MPAASKAMVYPCVFQMPWGGALYLIGTVLPMDTENHRSWVPRLSDPSNTHHIATTLFGVVLVHCAFRCADFCTSEIWLAIQLGIVFIMKHFLTPCQVKLCSPSSSDWSMKSSSANSRAGEDKARLPCPEREKKGLRGNGGGSLGEDTMKEGGARERLK